MTAAKDQDHPVKGISMGRLLLILLALPVYFVLFMFLPAGTWAWTKGWLFLGVFLGTGIVAALYLWRVNPEVVIARSGFHKGTKRWDNTLLGFFLSSVYAIIPVAALDDGRFHWFAVPRWVQVIGYALFLLSMGIVAWAETVNKFFEVTVRIQRERGQKVIDTGPYAIVRHPGYVGGIFFCVGMALCLGSLWALAPAGFASAVLIVRTQWEDQTLQAELPGYTEYARRVRYRWVPGVW